MERSQKYLAKIGLAAALSVATACVSFLGYRTFAFNHPHPIEIGQAAPNFTLPDTRGNAVSLASLKGKTVVLYFGSDQCATCKTYQKKVGALAARYAANPRVAFVAINSNTSARALSADSLRLLTDERNANVPTLLDPLAEVAHKFGVSVTPTFCIIDPSGALRYAGSFDGSDAAPDSQYCAGALARTVEGSPVLITSTQAFGRSIGMLK